MEFKLNDLDAGVCRCGGAVFTCKGHTHLINAEEGAAAFALLITTLADVCGTGIIAFEVVAFKLLLAISGGCVKTTGWGGGTDDEFITCVVPINAAFVCRAEKQNFRYS